MNNSRESVAGQYTPITAELQYFSWQHLQHVHSHSHLHAQLWALLPSCASLSNLNSQVPEHRTPFASQGFDQTVIDLFLDVFRSEMAAGGSNGPGQVLLSPFAAQQPASRHLRYHMPARFSKEVVRGIRSAAAKAFEVPLLLQAKLLPDSQT